MILFVLALLLLTFGNVIGVVSHKCVHEDVISSKSHPFRQAHHRALPLHSSEKSTLTKQKRSKKYEKSEISSNYSPFRIVPDYSQLKVRNATLDAFIRQQLIPTALDWFGNALQVRPQEGNLFLEYYCTDTWSNGNCKDVEIETCGFQQIPQKYFEGAEVCPYGPNSCNVLPEGEGINGDAVLFISASNDSPCGAGVIAYATFCQVSSYNDRPVSGFINFCSQDMQVPTTPGEWAELVGFFMFMVSSLLFNILLKTWPVMEHSKLYITIHEMSHVFAVDWLLFTLFRDPVTNEPLTERDADGYPPFYEDIGFIPSEKTVQFFNERGLTTAKLVSPNALKHAQSHFGCDHLNGVELENQGNAGSALSHTEARIYYGDLMNAELNPGASGVFSDITLAIFEDSGWYQVNYSYSQALPWGKNKGCDFAENSCLQNTYPRPISLAEDHFCTVPKQQRCTVGRQSKGICALTSSQTEYSPIPYEFRYFTASMNFSRESVFVGGWIPSADFCPLFIQMRSFDLAQDMDCRFANIHVNTTFTGEEFGTGSLCIDSDIVDTSLFLFINGSGAEVDSNIQELQNDIQASNSRCYHVECSYPEDGSSPKVLIFINGDIIDCGTEGGQVIPYNNGTWHGAITCPLVDQVCQESPCPNNCNFMGQCVNGECICRPGFYGEDCSQWE